MFPSLNWVGFVSVLWMLYSKCMDVSPEPLRCHKVLGENLSRHTETGESSSLSRSLSALI